MKLFEIFRFELAYQLRRPWVWLCMAILTTFAFLATRSAIVPVTLPQDFILNSPFIIASVTVFSCQIWLLIAPVVAGEAAARDVHMGMDPLIYASPVSKLEYLGGRFLAAFVLQALILLGVQLGSLLAAYAPGVNPDIIGPFRPMSYIAAYGLIALSNALIATTVQFGAALWAGRPIASYAGSMLLFFLSYPVTLVLYLSGLGKRALLADPIGVLAIMNEMMSRWTIVEKNVRMFALTGDMVANRLVWIAIAALLLLLTHRLFRFAQRVEGGVLARVRRRLTRSAGTADVPAVYVAVEVPRARQSFGIATQLRQALSIAGSSFRLLARSPAGLFMLVAYPLFAILVLANETQQWGIPLRPRTGYILSKHLIGQLTQFEDYRVMIPLLISFFAGELIWRERDAGLNENIDASPVPEWVLFFGKYLGLTALLVAFLGCLSIAAMGAQALNGYYDFEPVRYAQLLLGVQLPEYLLMAALALTIQAVVNQKYLGLLLTLVAYFLIVLSPFMGVHHKLLVYGASPAWTFTYMRGFGGTLGPWLWFKLYWAAWALLLAVGARLLWVRGREGGLRTRVRTARRRFTRATTRTAVLAVALILSLGGFIFYNTNVLNEYITDAELTERRAEYEKQYGVYEGKPQPERVHTSMRLDIHPKERTARMQGSYVLVNRTSAPIDSLHIEPAFYVDTKITFDRAARHVLADDVLGHHIYALEQPLQPGDTLTLNFDIRFERAGFNNSGMRSSGAGQAILPNGTYLTGSALPVLGYQPMRELWSAEDRRKYGLPRQVTLPPPGDIDAGMLAVPPATFDAVVSTSADQVAVAPGELRRTWTEGDRRYFHYVSDVPIVGMDVFFSARYAVQRERWNGVDVQYFVHPDDMQHIGRVKRSVRAALDYNSREFGAYPYHFFQFVEQPGNFRGMGVDGSGVVTAGEGVMQLDPQQEGFDALFEIVAHEVGHQWWGMQLKPAFAEGGGVISEGLAWYSAMQLVQREKGREALRRFMKFMREPNPWPEIRTGLPLLEAMDPWANYRKAPYVMHALSEYLGEERVNSALRTLVEKNRSSLATTLDMYHALQSVTPDSLKPLLHDFFEVNAFWQFDTKQAAAVQTADGQWQVTFEIDAHKTVLDSTGREREVPIAEAVELGVFAPAKPGRVLGETLYLRRHRLRSGTQTIAVMVKEKPARGGIDPYNLLDWQEGDNIEGIRTVGGVE